MPARRLYSHSAHARLLDGLRRNATWKCRRSHSPFSPTSIAPLFERRDVDRLRAQPDSNGVLCLEVRNEAMVGAARDAARVPDESVAPDAAGGTLALRGLPRAG